MSALWILQFAVEVLLRHEGRKGQLADCFAWGIDRGQRRKGVFREADVVKAGHRNIARDREALFAKFGEHTQRHEIIRADDRRGLETGSEECAGRLSPAGRAVAVRHHGVRDFARVARYGVEEGAPGS